METQLNDIRLIHGDCLKVLPTLADKSVDLILCDPPYNTTDCLWDKQSLDWGHIRKEFLRIIKPTGTICIFAQNPFSFIVGSVFSDIYRHRWVWEKDKCANFLCAKAAPLKYTEDILVFQEHGYMKSWNNNGAPKGVYNPQMRQGTGKAKKTNSEKLGSSLTSIHQRPKKTVLKSDPSTDGIVRYPAEIIRFCVPHRKSERFHPTQKPVALLEYLIKTYTNEGDTVLDCMMGSGSTMVACVNTNRKGVGIELMEEYYDIAVNRVKAAMVQPKLDL